MRRPGLTHWAGMSGHHTGPPCQAQTPKQPVSCYSLLGPCQHPKPPSAGGGSAHTARGTSRGEDRLQGPQLQRRPGRSLGSARQPPLPAVWGPRRGWGPHVRSGVHRAAPLSSHPTGYVPPPPRVEILYCCCLNLPSSSSLLQWGAGGATLPYDLKVHPRSSDSEPEAGEGKDKNTPSKAGQGVWPGLYLGPCTSHGHSSSEALG